MLIPCCLFENIGKTSKMKRWGLVEGKSVAIFSLVGSCRAFHETVRLGGWQLARTRMKVGELQGKCRGRRGSFVEEYSHPNRTLNNVVFWNWIIANRHSSFFLPFIPSFLRIILGSLKASQYDLRDAIVRIKVNSRLLIADERKTGLEKKKIIINFSLTFVCLLSNAKRFLSLSLFF